MSRNKRPIWRAALAAGLFAVALVSPSRAKAGELIPAISTQFGYDSNDNQRTTSEQGDFRARTVPQLSLQEEMGRLSLRANASVAYENALDFGGLDDFFDQFARLQLGYAATGRTRFALFSNFSRVRHRDRAVAVDFFALDEIPDPEDRDRRSIHNRSRFAITHQITSRWTAVVGATHNLNDYQSENRFDQSTMGADATLSYALNARTRVGLGTRYTYDSFDRTPLQRGSRARYYQGFFTLDYLIAPDLRMGMSAGPAWVEQRTKPGGIDSRLYPFVSSIPGLSLVNDFGLDPNDGPFGFLLQVGPGCGNVAGFTTETGCAPIPVPVLLTTANNNIVGNDFRVGGSSNETSKIDVFANFNLVKEWEWGEVVLTYNRRETGDGGTGTGNTADSLSLLVRGYQPAPLWDVSGIFSWTQRQSSGNIPQDLAALSATPTLFVDANGIIGATGTPISNVATADLNSYVTDGSFGRAREVTSYFLSLRASRRISKNLETFGTWSWRRDDRTGQLSRSTTLDIFRVFVGVEYTFDPISF